MLMGFLEAHGVSDTGGIDVPALLDYLAWTHERGVSAESFPRPLAN